MKIRDVLARKATRDVVGLLATESMREFVRQLRENRIGAMVILDQGGHLQGVISERDVVRALAEDGEASLDAPVERYMTREVQTTHAGEPSDSVLERMTQGRFRHMPVIAESRVIGVVSIGDLVKARIDDLERDNEALQSFIHG